MLYGKPEWNELTQRVLDACVEVHRFMGPGLLESLYEECLALELADRGLLVERQIPVPVLYKERLVSMPLKLDMLVEGTVVVELKAVDRVLPVHSAQVITYLKLTDAPVGLLVNFNVPLLKDGVTRLVRPNLLLPKGGDPAN